jgi:hypothetical protein
MEMRRTLRMPVFVAKKSQYRNCQQQEWVALGHGCAGGAEAEISLLESWSTESVRRHRKFFSKRIDLSRRILRLLLRVVGVGNSQIVRVGE